jgi:MarR family transcriptional regulator, organic hydroperoxide resistance regulator
VCGAILIIYFVYEICVYETLFKEGEQMQNIDESMKVVMLFKQVVSLLKHNMFKEFEHTGITPPQGMVLGNLSKFGKLKISDLSDKLGLSNSTISGIIDRMEKHDMVIRTRSQEDKRVVYVSLSPVFEERHHNCHMKAEENIQAIMNKGTHEDLDKIIDGLNTLKKLLSND